MLGGSDLSNVPVSPGHVVKCLFFMASRKVEGTGLKHAACRYLIRSILVLSFRMMMFNFFVEVVVFSGVG